MSSSLTDFVDGSYIAGEILLEKGDAPEKTCVLVEGQDDKFVFSKFISEMHCKIIDCNGKENLISAINILNSNSKTDGYLGIRDSDFDILNGTRLPSNTVSTDGHDLEVMILSTKALDLVVDIRVKGEDENAIDKFKSMIRSRLFELGSLIGYLRLVSHRNRWGIDIQTYRLLNHLDHDCSLSLKDAIEELKATDVQFDESQISIPEFEELLASNAHHLCQGHEMVVILGKIFTKLAKMYFKKKLNLGGEVSDRIFLVFDLSLFQSTQLYTQIQIWEEDNQPYKILTV